MLAFRVSTAGHPRANRSTGLPGEVHVSIGDLAVTWAASGLFAIALELADVLVLGEAVAKVPEKEIRQWIAGSRTCLPDGVHGLAAIDGRSGRVTLAASVRVIRSYSYTVGRDGLVFSTSLRALRAMGVDLAFDEKRLGEYLVYRYVSPPHTLCRGVRRLVGGEQVTVDLRREGAVETHACDFPAASRKPVDEGPVLDALERLRTEEIDRALERGGRASVLFSGGLDSTFVALAALDRARDPRLVSSSFSFVDPEDRELEYARSAAAHLGLDHEIHDGTVESYMRGLVTAVSLAEEPVHHLQSVLLLLLYEAMQPADGDLILCGEGADGLWGSDVHTKILKYDRFMSAARRMGGQGVFRWAMSAAGIQNERLGWFTREFGSDLDADTHVLWEIGAFGDVDRVRSITGCTRASIVTSRRSLMAPYADMALCDQVSVLSLLCEAGGTMRIWGKLAEARGFALHTPFTAPALIDLAFRLPWAQKLSEPKHFIRAALRRDGVPEKLIQRPKLGFGFPEHLWAPPGNTLPAARGPRREEVGRGLAAIAAGGAIRGRHDPLESPGSRSLAADRDRRRVAG